MNLTKKNPFFDWWSWFKFNNLGLALDIALKFYSSVANGLKIKVKIFEGLIPNFIKNTGEKLLGGGGGGVGGFLPTILNRVKCVTVSKQFLNLI